MDYADRQNYLTEADVGVSTHFSHVETTFSFRTRILDYLWAGLPMVVTEGDHFAQLVEEEKLGVVVPSGDVDALVAALETVLFDEKFIRTAKRNLARVRQRYFWTWSSPPWSTSSPSPGTRPTWSPAVSWGRDSGAAHHPATQEARDPP